MRLEQLEQNRIKAKKLQALTFSYKREAYIRVGLYPE